MHQFQNTGTAASTEIDFNDALFFEALQRSHMAGCDIHHVDVIPDTRSIRRIVIVSKYIQVWPAPHRYLGNERHQVVWFAAWVFTN